MALEKKSPVGAHYGLRDWLAQRATATVLAVVIIILFAALVLCRPSGYEAWRAFVMHGGVRLLLLLGIFALVWHAFIGVRDIFMDYIKHDMFRLLKITGAAVYLLVCLLWAAMILL